MSSIPKWIGPAVRRPREQEPQYAVLGAAVHGKANMRCGEECGAVDTYAFGGRDLSNLCFRCAIWGVRSSVAMRSPS